MIISKTPFVCVCVSKVKTLGGGEYANELVWHYNIVVKSTVFRTKVPILASSLNDLAKILNLLVGFLICRLGIIIAPTF